MSDVNSLLLLNSSNVNCSYSILFHCARYWALQGSRVLFISKTPLKHLPLTVGKTHASLNPDAFKLIQFMYLADWQELLKQLYSIHLRHNPVSVIIVKNLENYLKKDIQVDSHEDHVSLVCASLLHATSTCAKLISQPTFLINDYVCESATIEKTVVKNFFHNVWVLRAAKKDGDATRKGTFVNLTKLSFPLNNNVVDYTFSENHEEFLLSFEKIIKTIISVH